MRYPKPDTCLFALAIALMVLFMLYFVTGFATLGNGGAEVQAVPHWWHVDMVRWLQYR
ncbi:hypothetical protein VST7929_01405 [Vibrio stylophorae]|uniref:Uncharacterized protein n=1 Tax=Vibrio stylophorae TaxID=659351 RepID=A0ABM8ZT84_9VIBR|nr:hypothetical protein [Vibrio stylophorae]CAH0533535.1 hypothetical protein VST7929_01405 [Vibrio stylophorae]